VLTINSFRAIMEGIETPVLVADRTGRLLAANGAAKIVFELRELSAAHNLSVFEYLFQSDGIDLLEELATGRAWIEREVTRGELTAGEGRKIARIRITPDSDWLVVQIKEKTPDQTYEVWTTADGTKAAYVYQGKVAFVPCIGPHAELVDSCQYIGQPIVAPAERGGGITIGGTNGKMPVPYAGLSSLPRDPVALDRYLAGLPLRGWGPAPVRVFRVIEDLLITYVMPPALTAELYRALGNIPGVTVDRHATDIAGRHGIGFKIAIPSEQGGGFDELILDPKTFRLMGQQLTLGQAAGAKAGQIVGGVTILKTALVSGPGILP